MTDTDFGKLALMGVFCDLYQFELNTCSWSQRFDSYAVSTLVNLPPNAARK